MTEQAINLDFSKSELKSSVLEAAERIKKLSEDLRSKIHDVQVSAEDKALGLLQSVETISEKLHIKTDAEKKAFELLESVDGLSTKLQSYAEGFETKITESQIQFHLGLMEAMGKWDEIKSQASSVLGSVPVDTGVQSLFDEVKLRASLGKMETRDFIDKSKEEWSKAWHELSHESTIAVKAMNKSIGEMIHRFV